MSRTSSSAQARVEAVLRTSCHLGKSLAVSAPHVLIGRRKLVTSEPPGLSCRLRRADVVLARIRPRPASLCPENFLVPNPTSMPWAQPTWEKVQEALGWSLQEVYLGSWGDFVPRVGEPRTRQVFWPEERC